jgi:hypothetical protein
MRKMSVPLGWLTGFLLTTLVGVVVMAGLTVASRNAPAAPVNPCVRQLYEVYDEILSHPSYPSHLRTAAFEAAVLLVSHRGSCSL